MTHPDWSEGYVTDASYAHTFFRELSPAWLNYAAALNGITPRDLDRPFTYLELGCGFGNSTIVNAGAFSEGNFHACDFNPAHIEGGRRYAAALDIRNVQFHHASFHELLARDLPTFDFIALHGVYSWVGADSRQAIRRLVRERLKPGGFLYVSYNCMPGWAVEVPLRRLLLELAATDGDTANRTEQALGSLTHLSGSKLRYFNANPAAVAAVDAYAKGHANYLAHEFLNQTWEPFYSIDVADEMAEAGMSYVGSATLADNHPALVLDASAAEAVASLGTARQRQLAIDFTVNQRFRRDIFVRGGTRLTQAEMMRQLSALAIGSLGNPERIATRARVPRGEISFQDDFIRDVRALLHRGSMTIGEAASALGGGRGGANEIVRNLTFLVAAGTLMPYARAYQSKTAEPERVASPMLERVLAQVIEHQSPLTVPSEILGNGIQLRPSEALTISKWLADEQYDASEASGVIEGLVRTLVRLGLIR